MRKISNLRKNKKAISEVLGYVLLIVIAISLSVLVYAWLKTFVIKEQPSCPGETSIFIKDYSCNSESNTFNIAFQNNGMFNINGVIIRISESDNGKFSEVYDSNGVLENFFYNGKNPIPLAPGKILNQTISYSGFERINRTEIVPFISKNNDIIFCENAVIRQKIENCI